MPKQKKKMTRAQVEAQSILVNPYPYIEDEYDADIDYFTRQIEMHGSIKPEGHISIEEIEDCLPEAFDFYWNK